MTISNVYNCRVLDLNQCRETFSVVVAIYNNFHQDSYYFKYIPYSRYSSIVMMDYLLGRKEIVDGSLMAEVAAVLKTDLPGQEIVLITGDKQDIISEITLIDVGYKESQSTSEVLEGWGVREPLSVGEVKKNFLTGYVEEESAISNDFVTGLLIIHKHPLTIDRDFLSYYRYDSHDLIINFKSVEGQSLKRDLIVTSDLISFDRKIMRDLNLTNDVKSRRFTLKEIVPSFFISGGREKDKNLFIVDTVNGERWLINGKIIPVEFLKGGRQDGGHFLYVPDHLLGGFLYRMAVLLEGVLGTKSSFNGIVEAGWKEGISGGKGVFADIKALLGKKEDEYGATLLYEQEFSILDRVRLGFVEEVMKKLAEVDNQKAAVSLVDLLLTERIWQGLAEGDFDIITAILEKGRKALINKEVITGVSEERYAKTNIIIPVTLRQELPSIIYSSTVAEKDPLPLIEEKGLIALKKPGEASEIKLGLGQGLVYDYTNDIVDLGMNPEFWVGGFGVPEEYNPLDPLNPYYPWADEIFRIDQGIWQPVEAEGWEYDPTTRGFINSSQIERCGLVYRDINSDGYIFWTSFKVTGSGDDGVGIIFNYVDENNYYKFIINGGDADYSLSMAKPMQLYKVISGVTVPVGSPMEPFPWIRDRWYTIKVIVNDNRISLYVNNKLEYDFVE